jgi:hypothetical protein
MDLTEDRAENKLWGLFRGCNRYSGIHSWYFWYFHWWYPVCSPPVSKPQKDIYLGSYFTQNKTMEKKQELISMIYMFGSKTILELPTVRWTNVSLISELFWNLKQKAVLTVKSVCYILIQLIQVNKKYFSRRKMKLNQREFSYHCYIVI